MKASLKLREEQRKPLFKAKIPLNILGLPFQSSISAGDSKELCLGLGTFFESGPAIRVGYRPNDPSNPFSLTVKSGIGHFGSPIDAPMTMSAEFNFGTTNPNPRFFLHFKPQFGDFSIKKSQQSTAISVFPNKQQNGGVFEEDGSLEMVEKPGEYFGAGGEMTRLPLKSSAVEEAFAGVELGAKTVLPIINGAVLKLRWGMKFPEGLEGWFANPRDRDWPRGMMMIPQLKLNKIAIEHVVRDDKKSKGAPPPNPKMVGPGQADVAEACFGLKRQLEKVRGENALLGQALEDMRRDSNNGSLFLGVRERKISSSESDGIGNNGGGIDDVKKQLDKQIKN